MSEPSLRQLQHWVKSRIRPSETTLRQASFELPLNPQRGTPGLERLSVYAGGYLARVQESLAEVYEAVHHVLGEESFAALAHAYAERYPSHDYNLSFVGRHLPDFLLTSPLAHQLPFLPDVAKLEWLVCQAFHAFDRPPLDPTRVSSLSLEDWDRARLIFQPSVGLLASAWPILDIWQARTQPRDAINVTLIDRPQRVLIFRHDLHVQCELIDERQHVILEGLMAGRTLGTVCADLAACAGEEPLPVAAWFAQWVSQGLLVDYCFSTDAASSREIA